MPNLVAETEFPHDSTNSRKFRRGRMRPVGANRMPVFPVCLPDGTIRHMKFARNVTGGVLQLQDDEIFIHPRKMREGYEFLEDLYHKDPDPRLRRNGYRWYMEYARSTRVPREIREIENGKKRRFRKGFPVELLPEEVRLRMAGKSSVSENEWVHPDEREVVSDVETVNPALSGGEEGNGSPFSF